MKLDSRLVACGLCSVLTVSCGVAFAQYGGNSAKQPSAANQQPAAQSMGPCTDMKMLRGECGDQQKKTKQEKPAEKQPSQYPNATRHEPKDTSVSDKEAKALNEGLNAANSGDTATAQKDLQDIADNGSNAYAKAKALQSLAQIKYNGGDTKGAIALQKQALDLNSLPNDDYFPALYTLAQMYIADEDYAQALATLDQWTQQSGKPSADAYALKGNAYYRLEKYPEAVAAIQKAKSMTSQPKPDWDQILIASYFAMDKYDEAGKVAEAALARDPNNGKLLMNVVQIYTNAKQYDKALPLLERARANGQINDEATYVNMAKLYYNIAVDGRDPKVNAGNAAQVLEEGMGKGIVKPTADNYKLLGDAYNLAGDTAKADAAYDKGGVPRPEPHKSGKKKKGR